MKSKYDRRFSMELSSAPECRSFAVFIRAARAAMGLTQAEFAKVVGLSRDRVADLEKSRLLADPDLATRVAKKARLPKKAALQACIQDKHRALTQSDIGLLKFRSFVAVAIYRYKSHATAHQVSIATDISIAKVAAILRGQVNDASIEELLRVLDALGHAIRYR